MEESRLKQRLVGAMVLVALAVIFIPMLLSGGHDVEMPVFGSNVPKRSVEITNIKHIDIAAMKKTENRPVNPIKVPIAPGLPEPEVVKNPPPSLIDNISNASASLTKEKTKPAIKETVWAVQLGSFNKRSNALALKDKLRQKKTHAFIDRIMQNNKAVYRVRVGPVVSKKEAADLQQKLLKEMKLNGLVIKHP